MSGIHLFSKDLRIADNESLYSLINKLKCKDSYNSKILFVFHLDYNQLLSKDKEYHRSLNAIIFMFQCLIELNSILKNKLIFISGDLEDLQNGIISLKNKYGVKYLSKNMDYTEYATSKDNFLSELCKKINIEFIKGYNDQTICNMSDCIKNDGTPYITFSHFYNKLRKSYENNKMMDYIVDTDFINDKLVGENSLQILYDVCEKLGINKNEELLHNSDSDILQGGRNPGINRIIYLSSKENKKHTLCNFSNRDDLEHDRGLKISAYLNFGCISIREFIRFFNLKPSKLGDKMLEDVFKQMVWRDFYLCILRFSDRAKKYIWLDDRYNKLKWRDTKTDAFKVEWDNFINCKTRILLIDSAMKELKETGFMNNRARLLWATFAVKYMMADPFDKIYGAVNLFSRYLVDCSTSQNKMNFEWIISSLDIGGRRFSKKGENPLTGRVISIDNKMIKKYNAYNYIRKWLPEYNTYSDKELLNVEPLIDLKKRYQDYCNMFK